MAAMTHSQCRTQHISYQYGLFSNHCSCTCGEDGKPYCAMTKMWCTGMKTETGEDPAGNNEGCIEASGKRRKIGEKWLTSGFACTVKSCTCLETGEPQCQCPD